MPFAWSRKHTIAAATAGVVLVGGGIGAAVALTPEPTPATAPPAATTPTPTPTATPSPAAKPAATPKPDPVDPLTGGKPSTNKVLAVKVENIALARPQAGLSAADIVFVEEVEGRLTRLVAVYHRTFPKRVGPVRSARNTDVELLPMFGKPALIYSGANRKVQRNLDATSINTVQRSTRDPRRSAPHNVFVDLAGLAKTVKAGRPAQIGWTFAAKDARWAGAPEDRRADARVGGDAMSFTYTGERYVVRWKGQTYAGDGSPAKTDNVIVMQVKTRPDGNADVSGSRSVKSRTVGSGKVTIYRDGRKLSGTWKRSKLNGPMRFTDSKGRDIPLKPGRTWVTLSS